MFVMKLEQGDRLWTVCLRVVPDSPTATGLEFIFVWDRPDGARVRYAWPIEGELFDRLVEGATEIDTRLLQCLFDRAVEQGRTLEGLGAGSSPGG